MKPLAAAALIVALMALATACKAAEEAAVVTPSPSPTPGPTATLTPAALTEPKVVFIRSLESPFPPEGVLWMSDADGANRMRMTPPDEKAAFAGLISEGKSGDLAFYYVTRDGATARTLWRLDVDSGERSSVFTFESQREDQADAAISPDGRYVAYAGVGGIDLVDLVTGESRHLLDNGPRECDARTCFGHSLPQWSPDGTLLMVRKTFWEGGTTVILDPFSVSPQLFTNDSPFGPWAARWSPDSDLACGHGGYGESYLHVAQRPDWVFGIVPGYEQESWDFGIVASCAWVTRDLLAFSVNVSRPDIDNDRVPEYSVELLVFERSTGSARVIASFDEGIQIVSAGLVALPNSRWVATQNWITEPGASSSILSQPELFNVDTGERMPALQSGDFVVAVVQP